MTPDFTRDRPNPPPRVGAAVSARRAGTVKAGENEEQLPGRHVDREAGRIPGVFPVRLHPIQRCWFDVRWDGIDQAGEGGCRMDRGAAVDHLICPIGVTHRSRIGVSRSGSRHEDAGRELAPAFTTVVNRLLWRRRARPSATLDKMRTEL